MSSKRRVDLRRILAQPDLRRELMVQTLEATQAREGIDTTREQAERAYYVVTEAESAAFFDVVRFRAGKGHPDRRHEMFVQAIADGRESVRFDVARRDFAAVAGFTPGVWACQNHGSSIPREPSARPRPCPRATWDLTLEMTCEVRALLVGTCGHERGAVLLGSRSPRVAATARFYYDVNLVVHWDPRRRTFARVLRSKRARDGASESRSMISFSRGLTWTRRTQRGFNVRLLPDGCIFSAQRTKHLPLGTSAMPDTCSQSATRPLRSTCYRG